MFSNRSLDVDEAEGSMQEEEESKMLKEDAAADDNVADETLENEML